MHSLFLVKADIHIEVIPVKVEELVRAFYEVPGRIINLKSQQFLFREGDEAKYFYFVREGQIHISKTAESGRMLSLRLATKDSIIGELPLYQPGERYYIFDAMAKVKSEVYAIEYTVLEAYLEKRPPLAVHMLKLMAMHMRKQHSKFRDLVLCGKRGALASTLIRLANSYGKPCEEGILIPVEFTNQDLANYSATTRESLNRMLNDMRRNNIISIQHNHIILHDIDRLRAEIGCDGCNADICNIS